MTDNLAVKDGNGASRSVAAKDRAGVHYPQHIAESMDRVLAVTGTTLTRPANTTA